jgi:hypothetical protein
MRAQITVTNEFWEFLVATLETIGKINCNYILLLIRYAQKYYSFNTYQLKITNSIVYILFLSLVLSFLYLVCTFTVLAYVSSDQPHLSTQSMATCDT